MAVRRVSAVAVAVVLLACAHATAAHDSAFLDQYFTKPTKINKTEVEPYYNHNPMGVAVVPATKGKLFEGDVLVSNYANDFGDAGERFCACGRSEGGHVLWRLSCRAATRHSWPAGVHVASW